MLSATWTASDWPVWFELEVINYSNLIFLMLC